MSGSLSILLAPLFICGGLALAVLLGLVLYKEAPKTYPAAKNSKTLRKDSQAA
jgi:hypothetical protein